MNKLLTLKEASDAFWKSIFDAITEFDQKRGRKTKSIVFNPSGIGVCGSVRWMVELKHEET